MDFISNRLENNHLSVITRLIDEAQKIVICSGWIKRCGLKLLLPSIDTALNRGAAITIITNATHTSSWCRSALASRSSLRHVIVRKDSRLHTKLYYFENGADYSAVVGSANITSGGLSLNDELSILLYGRVDDARHITLVDYLGQLAE